MLLLCEMVPAIYHTESWEPLIVEKTIISENQFTKGSWSGKFFGGCDESLQQDVDVFSALEILKNLILGILKDECDKIIWITKCLPTFFYLKLCVNQRGDFELDF